MKRLAISTLIAALMHGAACMAATGFADVNKDVHNGTGQPAYGFKIVLLGTPAVIWHYDGYPSDWRFSAFEKIVVSAPEGQTTVLYWSQPLNPAGTPQPIPDCNWVHVGYRLELPADILEAYWTDRNGTLIPGGHVRQATQIVTLENRVLSVTIKNALRDELPLTIRVFGYRLWEGRLGLDSLNRNNPEMALSHFAPVPGAVGDITLAHDESRTFRAEIPASMLGPGGPPALILIKGDPKQESFVDIAQFYYGEPPGFPAVSQVGLVAMVALVLAAGTIVMARRPRHTTA
ncbi:MAG: hypothetical protein A2Y76_04500 [Planctomycetes bacterium RBG_13_60_9]|nr:MAG: hypothetical protein A2Y76_04500 [Planctomycetes bacterium RBG_13_60_9]